MRETKKYLVIKQQSLYENKYSLRPINNICSNISAGNITRNRHMLTQ